MIVKLNGAAEAGQPKEPEGWSAADLVWWRAQLPPLQGVAGRLGRPTFELLMAAGQAREAFTVLIRRTRGNRELEQVTSVLAGALQTLASSLERSLGKTKEELAAERVDLETTLNLLAASQPAPGRIIVPN